MLHVSRWLALCLLVVALVELVAGSTGDRSPAYQRCLASCISQCPSQTDANRFALWPCPAECQYDCTQRLTDLALASDPSTGGHLQLAGAPLEDLAVGYMVQYHGKWPFHRLEYGPIKMQEPLSVLFSAFNLIAHYHGWRALSRRSQRPISMASKSLASVYKIYALSGINTWVWSAVFHTRDVDWTEKADYFSAAGGILAGLWMAGVRLGGLYQGSSIRTTTNAFLSQLWAITCISIFAAHCIYLSSGSRFDYTYNMQFNVVIALATIALWAGWSSYHRFVLPSPSHSRAMSRTWETRAPHYHLPLLPLLLLPALSALELLDFAPVGPFGLRLLDAHALWHASTAPVVVIWYRFLRKDLDWIDECENGGARAEEGRRLD